MKNANPMSLKEWIITLILLFIPIVGLIMLIVWAVDKEDPRSTFSKAYLIVSTGVFVLMFIFYIVLFLFFFLIANY